MNYYFVAATILAQTEPVGVPAGVPIVIAVILLLLFWWGLNRNSIPQGAGEQAEDTHGDHHDVAVATAAPAAGAVPTGEELVAVRTTAVTLDDLKLIEGIGPKIEGVLHDAGINTFAQLAAASVSQLAKIVREDAGIRVAFPETWPEQAALAAAGNWTQLEQLQEELKGGRRA